MPKISPKQRKFLTKMAEPVRGERRHVARVDVDGHWQLIGALKNLGLLMRDGDDPGLYRFTPDAYQYVYGEAAPVPEVAVSQ